MQLAFEPFSRVGARSFFVEHGGVRVCGGGMSQLAPGAHTIFWNRGPKLRGDEIGGDQSVDYDRPISGRKSTDTQTSRNGTKAGAQLFSRAQRVHSE